MDILPGASSKVTSSHDGDGIAAGGNIGGASRAGCIRGANVLSPSGLGGAGCGLLGARARRRLSRSGTSVLVRWWLPAMVVARAGGVVAGFAAASALGEGSSELEPATPSPSVSAPRCWDGRGRQQWWSRGSGGVCAGVASGWDRLVRVLSRTHTSDCSRGRAGRRPKASCWNGRAGAPVSGRARAGRESSGLARSASVSLPWKACERRFGSVLRCRARSCARELRRGASASRHGASGLQGCIRCESADQRGLRGGGNIDVPCGAQPTAVCFPVSVYEVSYH